MIYLILFFEFFKIGLFCFGGAFGMIPIIKDVVFGFIICTVGNRRSTWKQHMR